MIWAALILTAYLLGSIPFGLLIARARGVDIRTHGSGNIGATNVGRVLGRPFGILCFLLDLLKGALPIVVAGTVQGMLGVPARDLVQTDMWLWLAVAFAAVLGHTAPIFLTFRGGKGVATAFGALLAMWPLLTLPAIGALLVWWGTLRLFHYVSLASVIGACSLPLWFAVSILVSERDALADAGPALVHASPPLLVTVLLAGLITYRHRSNIARLRRGEEPRVDLPCPTDGADQSAD